MAVLAKCLMGSACTVTGCCSIGLPVFASTEGGLKGLFQQISSSGETATQVSIEECNTQESSQTESIEYGAQNITNVCWKVNWGDKSPTNKENVKTYYTQLFKDMWNNKAGNWNTGRSGQWKSTCMKGSEQWVITGMDGGKEYLGWCYENQTREQGSLEKLFVKKDITNSDQVTEDNQKTVKISVCSGDCFSEKPQTESSSANLKQLDGEKEGNWKEVTFSKR